MYTVLLGSVSRRGLTRDVFPLQAAKSLDSLKMSVALNPTIATQPSKQCNSGYFRRAKQATRQVSTKTAIDIQTIIAYVV